MKWLERIPDKEGDLRNRTRFLFFPLTIAGQTRWLETATWVEQYVIMRRRSGSIYAIYWMPIAWRGNSIPGSNKPAVIQKILKTVMNPLEKHWRKLLRPLIKR